MARRSGCSVSPISKAAQRGIVGAVVGSAHLQTIRFDTCIGQRIANRNSGIFAASFMAAMRRPPVAAMARTSGRSGSIGLPTGLIACTARKR